jgi:hypothetical protein
VTLKIPEKQLKKNGSSSSIGQNIDRQYHSNSSNVQAGGYVRPTKSSSAIGTQNPQVKKVSRRTIDDAQQGQHQFYHTNYRTAP